MSHEHDMLVSCHRHERIPCMNEEKIEARIYVFSEYSPCMYDDLHKAGYGTPGIEYFPLALFGHAT